MPEGFYVENGYIGLVDGEWTLFATEEDYIEYLKEDKDENK